MPVEKMGKEAVKMLVHKIECKQKKIKLDNIQTEKLPCLITFRD